MIGSRRVSSWPDARGPAQQGGVFCLEAEEGRVWRDAWYVNRFDYHAWDEQWSNRFDCLGVGLLKTIGDMMDKRIRVFLIVCFCAFMSSLVIQTVFQKIVAGDMSTWGWNPGWQWEIASWNIGCGIVALFALRIDKTIHTIPVVLGFTVLFAFLGTNHLLALFVDPISKFHWPPFIANYVGLFFGARVLLLHRLRKLDYGEDGSWK